MANLSSQNIFLSYSRRNKDVMQRTVAYLREQGYKVWVDNERLTPGTPIWEKEIESAIASAAATVVLLSPDAKDSEWVRAEVEYSKKNNKRVFPVLVAGDVRTSVPLGLLSHQFADLRTDERSGLEDLTEAMHAYLSTLPDSTGSLQGAPDDATMTQDIMSLAEIPESQTSTNPVTSIDSGSSKRGLQKRWLFAFAGITMICILGVCLIGLATYISGTKFPLIASQTQAPQVNNLPTNVSTDTAQPGPSTEIATPPSVITTQPDLASAPDVIPLTSPTMAAPTGSDQISKYLRDVTVVNQDTFDDPSGQNWDIFSGSIQNGSMQIVGNADWLGAARNGTFGENEGIVLDFEFPQTSLAEIYWESGDWDTASYRRFGTYVGGNHATLDAYAGSTDLGGMNLPGDLALSSGKPYSLLLAVLPGGELMEVIWDPAQPSEALYYRKMFDNTWAGIPWSFYIGANRGNLQVDNFRQIQFSGVN